MVNNLTGFVNFKGQADAVKRQDIQKPQKQEEVQQKGTTASASSENLKAYTTTGIKSSLKSDDVRTKYSNVSALLEPETRVVMTKLLKSGILLNNNSNDGSTVLDNLNKIATEPRLKGLSAKTLVNEAINTIANPGVITQKFGDIPDSVANAVLRHPDLGIRTKEEMDVDRASSCCEAASLEYNIALTQPAEFVRMAEGLSSEDYAVVKSMKLSDIAPNRDDALWMLGQFKLPCKMEDDDNLQVLISPDRNAMIRARVQTSYQDKGERSSIDVLMQSAIMNVGCQQSYNSLNDTKATSLGGDNQGLLPLEASFTASVFSDEERETIIYMGLKDDGSIEDERACDYKTMASNIISSIEQGKPVIAGFITTDFEGKVNGGHAITIIGAGEGLAGELVFVCNDTQNGSDEPSYIAADYLLPKLHHANFAKDIVQQENKITTAELIPLYQKELLS